MHNPLASEGAAHGAIEPQQSLAGAARARARSASQHLINSKLKPPLCAAACIERRRCSRASTAAFRHKLVLLTAPIGSGKTTLLTQWYRRAAPTHAVAWLSLDERDNDPVRFFSYLIGAVHGAVPGFDAYIASRRAGEPYRRSIPARRCSARVSIASARS